MFSLFLYSSALLHLKGVKFPRNEAFFASDADQSLEEQKLLLFSCACSRQFNTADVRRQRAHR